jgi:hypothetical protein
VLEHRLLQLLQLRSRLDAQLVHERPAGVLVDVQRVGLAARAVEREHELAAQALAQRIPGDERLELADEVCIPPCLEVRLDALLERRQSLGLQVGDAGWANAS